jgi:hypothetical protein
MLLSSLQVSFHRRVHKTKACAFLLPKDLSQLRQVCLISGFLLLKVPAESRLWPLVL